MSTDSAIKVLLLEDDPDFARLVNLQLRRHSQTYVVDTAASLAEALQKLRCGRYDAVLSDLSLPDSEGFKTVSRIRQEKADLPVIVLTGLDDGLVETEILTSGAQDYLVKGEVGDRELNRAILHAVKRQQTTNEMARLVMELGVSRQQLSRQAKLMQDKNERLRQLYNTAQEFVDNVSHDFRTPLTVIKDYISIIREGLVGPVADEQLKMLEKVAIRADDLNNMVDDLLDVSKLESGLVGAWRRRIPAADLVRRTESLLRQRAEAKGVEFSIECAPDLPDVYCDLDKVDRVITNLAVNAMKFSGQQGRVRIVAETDPIERQVIVSVIDNGPGIDEELLETIFKRFRQIDSHLKSTVKGFGLGLNIAQQFCRLNLGQLDVTSKVGQGSTFSFTIPQADPVEVARRWLDANPPQDDPLQLLEITIDAGFADEFDYLLNCQIRSRDLMYRIEPDRWLLMLVASIDEEEQWAERIEEEFTRHNRNRPQGPLDPYQVRRLGSWEAGTSNKLVLEEYVTILDRDERACEVESVLVDAANSEAQNGD